LPRRRTALVVVALAIWGIAACGGGDGESFEEDFPALSQRIISLGEEVGNAIETADSSTDQQLSDEFDGFAQQLGDLRQELEDLEPPDELTDEREDLVSAMGGVRTSLEDIAHAAEDGDPEAAREATLELVERSDELRDARRELARAVSDAD
jgi:predicted  nucleic acid-binding Zn-ribbon protein